MSTKNPNVFDKIMSFFSGDSSNDTEHGKNNVSTINNDTFVDKRFTVDIERTFDNNGSNADFNFVESRELYSHEFGGISFENDSEKSFASFGDTQLEYVGHNYIFSNGPDSGIHYSAFGDLGKEFHGIITTPFELMEVRNYDSGERFLIRNETKPLDADGTRVEITTYRGEHLDKMEVSAVTVVNTETRWVEEQTMYTDRDGLRETITIEPQDWGGPEYHYNSEASDEISGRSLSAHYESGAYVEIEATFLPVHFCTTVEQDGDKRIEKNYFNHMADCLGMYRGSDSKMELSTVSVTEPQGDREITHTYDGRTHETLETRIKYEDHGREVVDIYDKNNSFESREIGTMTITYEYDGDKCFETVRDSSDNSIKIYEVDENNDRHIKVEYTRDEGGNYISAEHYTDEGLLTETFTTDKFMVFDDYDKTEIEVKYEHRSEIRNESGELVEIRIYDKETAFENFNSDTIASPDIRTIYETSGDNTIETRYLKGDTDTYDRTTIFSDGSFKIESIVSSEITNTEHGIVFEGEKFFEKESDSYETRVFETSHGSNGIDCERVTFRVDGETGQLSLLEKTTIELETCAEKENSPDIISAYDIKTTTETYTEDGSFVKTVAIEREYSRDAYDADVKTSAHIEEKYDADGKLSFEKIVEKSLDEYGDSYGHDFTKETTYNEDGSVHVETHLVSEGDVRVIVSDTESHGSRIEKTEIYKDNHDGSYRIESTSETRYDSDGNELSTRLCEYSLPDEDGDRIAYISETSHTGETITTKEIVSYKDTALDVKDVLGEEAKDTQETEEKEVALKIVEFETIPFEDKIEVTDKNTILFNDKEFTLNTDNGQGLFIKDWECKDGDKELSIKTIGSADGAEKVVLYTETEKTEQYGGEEKIEIKTTVEYGYDNEGKCDAKAVTYVYEREYSDGWEVYSKTKEVITELYKGDDKVERNEEKTYSGCNTDYDEGNIDSVYSHTEYGDGQETKETVSIRGETSPNGIDKCEISKEILVTNDDGSSTEISESYKVEDGEVIVTSHTEIDFSSDGDKTETRITEYGSPDKDGDCIRKETTLDGDDNQIDSKKDFVKEKDIPRFEGDLHEMQDYIDQEKERDAEKIETPDDDYYDDY